MRAVMLDMFYTKRLLQNIDKILFELASCEVVVILDQKAFRNMQSEEETRLPVTHYFKHRVKM
jgi:hypothetical protein